MLHSQEKLIVQKLNEIAKTNTDTPQAIKHCFDFNAAGSASIKL